VVVADARGIYQGFWRVFTKHRVQRRQKHKSHAIRLIYRRRAAEEKSRSGTMRGVKCYGASSMAFGQTSLREFQHPQIAETPNG
jgi:hypothetical protein